jgi:hypothetical protein
VRRLKRARRCIVSKAYRIAVLFARHGYLQHGLHEALQPELSADLSPALKENTELFGRWWVNTGD